jgi:uncharacterized protein DUF6282
MVTLSVEGFVDTHVHTGPAPFRRIGDTIDIAKWCAEAGMAGIVIKSHFEATIAKVYHARKEVPDLPVFAGVALNIGAGGINPGAVEQALRQDARFVWMPTLDSANHRKVFGKEGVFGSVGSLSYGIPSKHSGDGYTILNGSRLTDAAKDVVDLIADHKAVLATGHLDSKEIMTLVEYAISRGVKKIIITHPEMYVPNLDIRTQVELAEQGCFMEYCAVNCMLTFHCVTPEQFKEAIDAVTPARAILATDSGQPFSPKTPDLFRIFVQALYERGVPLEAIAQMAIKNPAALVGIVPKQDHVVYSEANVGLPVYKKSQPN